MWYVVYFFFNLRSFSCIFLDFVLHVHNNHLKSSNIAKPKFKMADLSQFFTSLILPCAFDNFPSFSFILLKFVPHVVNSQFSNNFNSGGFITISAILHRQFYIVVIDNLKGYQCILLKFVANNQFSDKVNNGGSLLSSVLLFLWGATKNGEINYWRVLHWTFKFCTFCSSLVDVTAYIYFTCYAPLVYITFLRDFFK